MVASYDKISLVYVYWKRAIAPVIVHRVYGNSITPAAMTILVYVCWRRPHYDSVFFIFEKQCLGPDKGYGEPLEVAVEFSISEVFKKTFYLTQLCSHYKIMLLMYAKLYSKASFVSRHSIVSLAHRVQSVHMRIIHYDSKLKKNGICILLRIKVLI